MGFNFSSSYREFELSGVRVIGIILYLNFVLIFDKCIINRQVYH